MAAGRPRAFNTEEALESALKVFWEKGYEGASLPDLTEAMGINRPSLYAAFGNKESLFRKALDAYTQKAELMMSEALNLPTAKQVVEKMLLNVAEKTACGESPRGCLLVQGALSCGEDADPIRNELANRRIASEAALRTRLERAVDTGEIASHVEAASLAKFYMSVMQGMAVQSLAGASTDDLRGVASAAMRAFPA